MPRKENGLRHRLTKPGKVDPSETGITFVDVLFALVVTEVFEPIPRWEHLPRSGQWHLVVAVVLTLTSWIGYHTSKNRPRYEIRFFNWPFWQFVLDVGMVLVYWITITTHETSGSQYSAWPEARLVLVTFVLYSAWDLAGWRIKASEDYPDSKKRPGDWRRRSVTFGAAAAAVCIALTARLAQHNSWERDWVYLIDLALIGLLIVYRIAKEAVTPVDAPEGDIAHCPYCGCPSTSPGT